MELDCPAGPLASLKAAVDQDADAVCIGCRDATNARNREGLKFDDRAMREGIAHGRQRGRQRRDLPGVAGGPKVQTVGHRSLIRDRILPVIVSLAALLLTNAAAGTGLESLEPDLDNGWDINETCAGCHGEFGEGGKDGEYPRLAGQPKDFIIKQLLLFRDRTRPNLAMVEYVDHRQMPDQDIVDISAYLAAIELPTSLPPADESAPGFNAYQRLLDAKRVLQIPRADGDIANGEKLYRKECDTCHGRDGYGRHDKGVPMLAGQYTSYLWRQVPKYLDGIRIHDEDSPSDELLREFSEIELRDIFAYLSVLDD